MNQIPFTAEQKEIDFPAEKENFSVDSLDAMNNEDIESLVYKKLSGDQVRLGRGLRMIKLLKETEAKRETIENTQHNDLTEKRNKLDLQRALRRGTLGFLRDILEQ